MENSGIISLVFATKNQHKTSEIQDLAGNRIHLLNLSDIGFEGDIPEEQDTLEGNATQKAFFIYNKYGLNCFADDTGLEIEALNGAPGVFSARYAGVNCSFEDNVNKVLEALSGINHRRARFRTVIALAENEKLFTFEGEINGEITWEKRGRHGFGYDPVFMPDGYNLTFAEMNLRDKNRISHRAIAFQKLISFLLKNIP